MVIATFGADITLEEAVATEERSIVEDFLKRATGAIYIKLDFHTGKKQSVTVQIIENPSGNLISSQTFSGGSKFEEFKSQFTNLQQLARRNGENELDPDRCYPGGTCSCRRSDTELIRPEPDRSRCGQFCGSIINCQWPCPRCYYTGGACRWQKSCSR